MPAFDVALVELGHLLGFFKADGEVDWNWFGDPTGRALASLPLERERIGALIRALLDRAAATGAFNADANWEPIVDTNNVGLGFAWSSALPLRIGLGAKANVPISGQQITLAALARLIQINGSVTPQLGQFRFDGTFPVPDFLSSGAISGEVGTGTNAVNLTAKRTPAPADSRTLEYPNPVIAWDAARLAVFVLKSWIAQRAAANDEFFRRINDHLFPMIGDPAGLIAAFPLVAPMKSSPNFDAWRASVLTTDNNAAGALTFLWHARALLTGNEDPGFFNGSFFFPLSGAPQAGNTPTLANAVGNYVRPTGTNGAWVGLLTPPTEPPGNFTLVLDLETTAPARTCRIPLGRFDGTNFIRPNLDASWQNIVQFIASGSGFPIGNELLSAVADGGGFRLSLLRVSVATPAGGFTGFDGNYDLAIRLENGQPPEFVLGTPALNLALPPDGMNPEQLVGDLVVWALKAAAPTSDFGQLLTTAAEFIRDELTGAGSDAVNLLTKIAGVAGQGQKIELSVSSDASIELEIQNGKLLAGVEFGPIEDDLLPLYVGKLKGGVTVNPAASAVLDGFMVGFENLRLSNSGSGSGIVASLIPDMRPMPGFQLTATYAAPGTLSVTGGGKIPIQRTLGPLEIAALLVDVREESLAIGLDLGFELGPIAVAAYELGLRVGFKDGSIEPFLHGLGLSMDTGMLKLAGFFAAVENAGVTDYVGGAVVSVAGYFELSAIGGYTQLEDDTPSLFIFASLVAPLGGPPWFFITGVAGGFGFNRSLPAPGLMLEHPFLKVMRGEIAIGGNAAENLKSLAVHFAAAQGQNWIAAGIQFTAFGFINGKVVVAIGFGSGFSMQILGMASFGIPPICYFEIGIEVTADEEKFIMRARLSPNSYVIHPDIFSLQGDFALCAWYSNPHKGDFLFSIGGYHPLFLKPAHYPELMRVGAKAVIFGFVNLRVETFFCCTPQALMAGATISLWAEFAGIAAGLDVYVDVLMTWDPFFLRARIGVHIWFVFFGRHEVGVDLDVWTPEFGGIATIDLALVEFDVEFGAKLLQPPAPQLFEFLSKQVGVPATAWNGGARTLAFSSDSGAGLFRVEFLTGRSGKQPAANDEKQNGLDSTNPVLLAPEFSFLVRTRLPIGKVDVSQGPGSLIEGQIDLPLCTGGGNDWLDRASVLEVKAPHFIKARRVWLSDFFPAASFGDQLPAGRDAISTIKSDQPSISLIEGMIVHYEPEIPSAPLLTAPLGEPSDPEDSYPIPLGLSGVGVSIGLLKVPFAFGTPPDIVVTLPSGISRRDTALADLRSRKRPPFSVSLHAAELQRFTKLSAGRVFTVAAANAAEVPAMSPPVSPARPFEMFGVQLRAVPVRSNEPVRPRQMETLTRPKALKQSELASNDRDRDGFQSVLNVAAGRASLLEFAGGGVRRGSLRLGGEQTTRSVVFSRGGAVLLDACLRGSSELRLPQGTAKVLIIGEGQALAPAAVGVERESVLLAVGSRQFVGHGCVISVCSSLDLDVSPMDSLPGAELFEQASMVKVSFANATRDEGALILKLVPAVDRPGPAAEQVRWLAEGARLRSVVPVVTAGRVAFVMSVRAPSAWSATVDIGPDWRFDGIVFVPRNARLVVADLQRSPNWDLVDDSMPEHSRNLITSVHLEVSA